MTDNVNLFVERARATTITCNLILSHVQINDRLKNDTKNRFIGYSLFKVISWCPSSAVGGAVECKTCIYKRLEKTKQRTNTYPPEERHSFVSTLLTSVQTMF